MYSSNPNEFQKFSTAPPPYSKSVTSGVPVSSTNQFYSDNSKPPIASIQCKTLVHKPVLFASLPSFFQLLSPPPPDLRWFQIDEDLSFLEAVDDEVHAGSRPDPHQFDGDDVDDEDFENYDDFEVPSRLDHEGYSQPKIDERG
uniref:Uncharacterized protein n=1 Tax=Davidia involucrata TaxID=16924 RepID=A0A5B7BFV5_DAVIN